MGEARIFLGMLQRSVPAYTATETMNVMHHLIHNYSSDQVSRWSALFLKSYMKHFPNPHTNTRLNTLFNLLCILGKFVYAHTIICFVYIYTLYIYTHTYIYMYILYTTLCVCVCVWPHVRYLWLGPEDIDKRLLLGQESWQY